MSHALGSPMLRLVGARVDATPRLLPPRHAPNPRGHADGERVAAENRAAAALSDDDARWILALQTASMLEGPSAPSKPGAGNANGRLRPERRRRVHELATRLGLRAFDANLIIAVVQDAAVNEGQPLSPACRARLTLVGPSGNPRPATALIPPGPSLPGQPERPREAPVASPPPARVIPDGPAPAPSPDLAGEIYRIGAALSLGTIGAVLLALWVIGT